MEVRNLKTQEQFVDPISEYYVYTPSATAQDLFFYPTQIGYFQYQANYLLKRSNFHNFLIMLILDGECDLNLNGQRLHAKKGCITLIDCYAPHQYGSSCGWKALWLHFNGPMARKYYNYLSQKYGNMMISSEFYTIYHEMKEILEIFKSGSKINEIYISQKLNYILNKLIDSGPEPALISSAPVKAAIAYMNEHFAEPLTLNNLAEKACLRDVYKRQLPGRMRCHRNTAILSLPKPCLNFHISACPICQKFLPVVRCLMIAPGKKLSAS